MDVGELIQVRREARYPAPKEFYWRGRRHQVRACETAADPRAARGGLRLYRVRTMTGLRCTLSEDTARGQWRMERVLSSNGRPS
jgi:hypothetical protein